MHHLLAQVSSVFSASDATVVVAAIGFLGLGIGHVVNLLTTRRQGVKIDEIQHTVTTNGGKNEPPTLPDRIGALERELATLSGALHELRELVIGLAKTD